MPIRRSQALAAVFAFSTLLLSLAVAEDVRVVGNMARAAEPIQPAAVQSMAVQSPADLWIDTITGEKEDFPDVVEDLSKVDVIFLGERHTIPRHHDLQAKVVSALGNKNIPFALGLEQMESEQQPKLDRFNRGEIDFDRLAKETDWSKRWNNYAQYAPILKAAQKAHAPVVALNARAETIRQVARGGGVERLSAELRKQLPARMQLADPVYEKLLSMQLMVHMAAKPEVLRPMIEAQMVRDEAMAESLAAFRKTDSTPYRKMIVLCGSGHIAYGLGLPARVRARLPQAKQRIIIFSEEGDLKLTPEEQAQARQVSITHQQLRELDRPLADYIVVKR
jgi:uncharacterized iron-regulated protein